VISKPLTVIIQSVKMSRRHIYFPSRWSTFTLGTDQAWTQQEVNSRVYRSDQKNNKIR